ncbi:MAG: hypothetical protein Kow0090_17490 [Myxococcota bacterium]
MNAGKLPNIQKLISEGVIIRDGISSFPSMTGYGFYPFITGEDAVYSGVLGLRWIDRKALSGNFKNYVGRTSVQMNNDLRAEPLTLYERFPNEYSVSINTFLNRGVAKNHILSWTYTTAKYQDVWWLVKFLARIPLVGGAIAPDWHRAERLSTDLAIAELANKPKIQWVTLASPDGYHHIAGTDDYYENLLTVIDENIGRYRAASQKAGQEENRIYLLVPDHGMVDVRGHLDLREVLAKAGLNGFRGEATLLWTSKFKEKLSDFDAFDAFVVINGNTMNYLYFRKPGIKGENGFRKRLSFGEITNYAVPGREAVNLIELLVEREGVELVAALGEEDNVEIYGKEGKGIIRSNGIGYSYISEGRDPLRYRGDEEAEALMDGEFHSPDEWLSATHDLYFPYAVVRLHRLLSNPDCGDIVTTAAEGYDFAPNYELFVGDYLGGHGGLRADQLRVTYILKGAGVKRGVEIVTGRSEDVGATLLRLLGVKTDYPIKGRVLRDALENEGGAEDENTQ